MKHSVSHETAPVRWGVVVRIVLAVCLAAIIIFAIWCAAAILTPQADRAATAPALESYAVQNISARMLRVETMLHIR